MKVSGLLALLQNPKGGNGAMLIPGELQVSGVPPLFSSALHAPPLLSLNSSCSLSLPL